MELFIHCEKERSGIVSTQLSMLGFACQTPIPFDLGNVSPKSKVAINGRSDACDKSALHMYELIVSQPWFNKDMMFAQVVHDRMTVNSFR